MDARDIQRLEQDCVQDDPPWCQAACPLHVDARGMNKALARGDFRKAASTYSRRVPFPGILSRICDQPCREVCKRREAGDAINIRLLERSSVDHAGFSPEPIPVGAQGAGRIAVVGSGLSGLSASLELLKRDYRVVLFEAADSLGGRLRRIPTTVLTPAIVDDELDRLIRGGVEVRVGTYLGRDVSLTRLLEEFDAVYLGVGIREPSEGATEADPGALKALSGKIDAVTLATGERAVFAGGSLRREGQPGLETREYSPVSSMADGRRAAVSIDRFVKGESIGSQREDAGSGITRLYTSLAGVEPRYSRALAGMEAGYTSDEAVEEAERCLLCECMECVKACVYLDHFSEYPGGCIRKVAKNITSLPGKSYRTHTKFVNACSLCGLCGAVCPTELSMATVNSEARRIMWEKGFMPPAIHEFALRDLESSNSEAGALSRNQPGCESSTHLFFPGCQLSASAPEHVERTYAHLAGTLSGGVGLMLGCCGAPAAWAGRRERFQDTLDAFVQQWRQLGQPRVILACPTCSLMFKRSLLDVPTVSLWEVLDSEGLPPGSPRGQGEVLAVHDSCTARSAPEIQNSVRRIAHGLGYQTEELPYSRQFAKCCGYGGLAYQVNREVTDKVILSRIEESSTDYLTYCTNCRDFFADKHKASYHVLDLVFDGYSAGAEVRAGPTLSERRKNRRELAARMLKEYWGESMPEPPEHMRLKVRLAPGVEAKMEQSFILLDDVKAVIYEAERTGNKLALSASGRFIAHLRSHIVTYWVEYAKDQDEYEVFNAYSHRMQIVGDVES